MIKIVVICFGYCESAQISSMIFSHEVGFNTPEEAVKNLYKAMVILDEEKNGIQYKKTCPKCKHVSSRKNTICCSQCGTKVEQVKLEWDENEFLDFMYDLRVQTIDDIGSPDNYENSETEPFEWELFAIGSLIGADPNEVLFLSHYGPEIIWGIGHELDECPFDEYWAWEEILQDHNKK